MVCTMGRLGSLTAAVLGSCVPKAWRIVAVARPEVQPGMRTSTRPSHRRFEALC